MERGRDVALSVALSVVLLSSVGRAFQLPSSGVLHHGRLSALGGAGPAVSRRWGQPERGCKSPPLWRRRISLHATEETSLVGEDAAAFSIQEQSLESWGLFGVLVTLVLGSLYAVWISPDLVGLSDKYIAGMEDLCNGNIEATIFSMLALFAVIHSGLASLRPLGEEVIGARAWRVMFALVSLPLAYSAIAYFVDHRLDGTVLWNAQGIPGFHDFCWVLSFVSFLLLYPSTFNLLEVAAVDKPQLHLWETGVIRITRHPQLAGQAMWCAAHTLWTGTSFSLATSLALVLHHSFASWNGDRRLKDKHGEAFEDVKARTSIMPFAAIIEGRQELPADYWREWARAPYAVVVAGTLGAYAIHPFFYGGVPTWFVPIQEALSGLSTTSG